MSTQSAMYTAQEMPRPSADLMATQFIVEAYLRSVKPKARQRFHQALLQVVEEAAEEPPKIHQAADHASIVIARRQATGWLARVMRGAISRCPMGAR